MPLFTRRRLLGLAGLSAVSLIGARFALPSLLRPRPAAPLGPGAETFARRCFDGLDRRRVWDLHCHLVGLGCGGTGCSVNEELLSELHPIKSLQFDLYLAAAGIDDPSRADEQYLARLLQLHRLANPEGKVLLLAFDHHVSEAGEEVPALTEFHTPNEYVLEVARANPDVLACASVHPYRRDALERLDRAIEGGARAIKWLPNAMGIDPASPRCDAFYRRLAELHVPLLTHGGREQAVDAREAQRLGNPLRVRRALDAGVTVIVAHVASLGDDEDLDGPQAERATRSSFELCLRMLSEKQYERTLFADVSAIAQINRCCGPLADLLRAQELHHRLLDGSDYPLPAIDPLVSTRRLEAAGLLSAEDRRLCNEVFAVNPLLFDFVVKRSVRLEEGGKAHRFRPEVFETARVFDPPPA